jgi:hypothetical protein
MERRQSTREFDIEAVRWCASGSVAQVVRDLDVRQPLYQSISGAGTRRSDTCARLPSRNDSD